MMILCLLLVGPVLLFTPASAKAPPLKPGGDKKIVVPNVVGKPWEAARQELKSVGLEIGLSYVTKVTTDAGQNMKVADQSPQAGSQVVSGTPATLTVFKFKPSGEIVVVPKVIGLTLQQAGSVLGQAHLQLAVPKVIATKDKVQNDKVIGQEPEAGQKVPSITRVVLTVYRYQP
jgi:beta-lactam-binding protein with PASTA domain